MGFQLNVSRVGLGCDGSLICYLHVLTNTLQDFTNLQFLLLSSSLGFANSIGRFTNFLDQVGPIARGRMTRWRYVQRKGIQWPYYPENARKSALAFLFGLRGRRLRTGINVDIALPARL